MQKKRLHAVPFYPRERSLRETVKNCAKKRGFNSKSVALSGCRKATDWQSAGRRFESECRLPVNRRASRGLKLFTWTLLGHFCRSVSEFQAASAIQIVRPRESTAEAQLQLQPALLSLSAMISKWSTRTDCASFLVSQLRFFAVRLCAHDLTIITLHPAIYLLPFPGSHDIGADRR